MPFDQYFDASAQLMNLRIFVVIFFHCSALTVSETQGKRSCLLKEVKGCLTPSAFSNSINLNISARSQNLMCLDLMILQGNSKDTVSHQSKMPPATKVPAPKARRNKARQPHTLTFHNFPALPPEISSMI